MNSNKYKFDQTVGTFEQSLLPIISDMDKKDVDLIQQAFHFANDRHKDQKRISGEPYFTHPLSVAKNIAIHNPDAETIAAALLHDVVEDCDVTLSQISDTFNEDISKLVDGVTKISSIGMKEKALGLDFKKNHFTSQIDSYRKLLTAMAGDPRVLIIKLYDRLHNSQTLEWLPGHRQKFYALENIEIFAPLAERIGMSSIKSELEDLSFPYAFPEDYGEFIKSIASAKTDREKYIDQVVKILSKKLPIAEIYGRAKHNFSIFNKLAEKETIDNIHDLVAVRIIVPSVKECYETLAKVHEIFKPINERLEDNILRPRESGYQSIHTTVVGPENVVFEIQIRTPEMHQLAEFGIAAHWYYKEKKFSKLQEKGANSWINELNDGEAITSKKQFFANKIFVFSPQGKIIELPKNATPLDFAFYIHSDLGLSCFGAKVNSKIVPISSKLKTGDIIEIIKSDRVKPSRDWLRFVQTNYARNKIRDYFVDLEKPRYYQLGLDVVNTELEILKKPIVTDKNTKQFSNLINDSKIPFSDVFTALVAVGKKDISKKEFIKTIYPDVIFDEQTKKKSTSKEKSVSFEVGDGFTHRIANCCKPTSGDEIIGYITLQKIITVHKKTCKETKRFDGERILKAFWK